ncbi:MAG: (2Fe-2S)-binding protein [Microthrixaceae bacterium]
MIVCHCHRLNDRDIAAAVSDGANDLDDLGRACRAGTDCGGCLDRLEAIMAEVAVTLLPRAS